MITGVGQQLKALVAGEKIIWSTGFRLKTFGAFNNAIIGQIEIVAEFD
jgi:hypothetical protein